MKMDLYHPKTYTEKMQWLKLYDPNTMRATLTDKVLVRDWVKDMIGEEYLIPVIGIYNTFDEIDFDQLPNRFVMKTNHSSGWNIVVKDKHQFDKREARRKFNRWLRMDYAYYCQFEIHYSEIKPKIIIEKYMEDKSGGLTDYKFLCFDGKPEFVWVDFDRFSNHKRNVYNLDWELQPWTQFNYGNYEGEVNPPKNFELMKELATKLCKGFIHVRVDLYNIDGYVYFGEMTFTNGGGMEPLYPYEYDTVVGNLIHLPFEHNDITNS